MMTLGAMLSLGTGGCKRENPTPAIAESASPVSSAPPPASAAAAAAAAMDAPHGPEDVAADIYTCAEGWWITVKADTERCSKLLPLWSEGGVEAAARKYKAGCDGGDGRACLLLVGGVFHPQSPFQAKNKPEGDEEVARLLIKACELGEPNACLVLTQKTYCTSDDIPPVPYPKGKCATRLEEWLRGKGHAELAALLEPGCKKGNARSCVEQGRHLRQTSASVDEPRALYARGCELGNADGCSEAARIAKQFGQEEERKDFIKKKFIAMERECRRFHECTRIGGDFRNGSLLPEHAPKVRELLSFMCEKREASDEQCLDLADMQAAGEGGPVDAASALRRYQAICDKPIDDEMISFEIDPIAAACRGLARLYRSGTGVPKDEAKATQFLKKVCVKREPSSRQINDACHELSNSSAGGGK
jgi:TPR repeat protein